MILFFVITIGIKLAVMNTFILLVTWPENQYVLGIGYGFLGTAALFSPLFILKKNKNKIATVVCFLISLLIFIDTVYYSYFSSLPTVGLLNSVGQVGDVGPAVGTLFKWSYLIYFVDIFLVIIFRNKLRNYFNLITASEHSRIRQKQISFEAMIITITVFVISLFFMGSANLVSMVDKGYDTKSTSQYYGLLIAHGVDIVRFIEQETTHPSKEQISELSNWIKNNKPTQGTSNLNGVAKNKNIIMVQVESLGAFVIDQKINNKEITPNLNTLAKTSEYFPNTHSVMGAGHTSDTDFVTNTSYFPMEDSATFVRFGQDDFTSLPKSLIGNGYSAYAYHSYNRNFWNRNVALNSIGYQKFYAADSYPKGTVINMGLSDGEFLSATVDFIKEQPKPSLSYAITLTSHVPFETTDQSRDLGLKSSDYPHLVGNYLETINYTDRMLGKLFDKLKENNLYNDSLIIIYGDHTPVLASFSAGTIKYDPNTDQEKEVPLLIKLPNQSGSETHKDKGTLLDIMPTVLDLTGTKTSDLMFGQSLFIDESEQYKKCDNQFTLFLVKKSCKEALGIEKNKSSQIIRYNLFEYLPK